MKKTVFLSMLLALLLLLAPGASADSGCALGEAYLTVEANGTVHAVVTVTADRPCTLYTALYDASGRFRGLTVQDVKAGTTERSIASVLSAPQEEGLYARFFLTERNTPTPLAQERIAAASGVYALLYEDGTLVFQTRNQSDPERGAAKVFPVDLRGYQGWYDANQGINICTAPWYAYRRRILRVEFADVFRPLSTRCWFFGCSWLKEISQLHLLDTSAVTDMGYMFYGCGSLTSLNVSGLDTSAVTDMGFMFCRCSSLTVLDVSEFDTSAVTDMRGIFSTCSGLTALDVSGFNTSAVTKMGGMFGGCSSLTALDVSGFDTSTVTDMRQMFYSCSGLATLDVSGFDTSVVTDMSAIFSRCSGLTALDLSGFDTSAVTKMAGMFVGCSSLTALDVSGFDTSAVTDMLQMFYRCSSLTTLDVSGFDTSAVTDVRWMFYGCNTLRTIYASERFSTESVTSSDDMFNNCPSLVGGNGTPYDSAHTDKTYARIDRPGTPGYFTAK